MGGVLFGSLVGVAGKVLLPDRVGLGGCLEVHLETVDLTPFQGLSQSFFPIKLQYLSSFI